MDERSLLTFVGYALDGENEQLKRGEQAVRLTNKAFAVLRYLVENAGQLVTKEELLASVWSKSIVSENSLTNCIGEVRQALGDNPKQPQFIETVHRRGYRFLPTVTTQPVPNFQLLAPSSSLVPHTHSTPILVGREAEFTQLHELLERALYGERQLVFVTGEAGIGKTALIEAFQQKLQVGEWSPFQVSPESFVHGQCIEQYGASEAYLPVLEALGRLGRGPWKAALKAVLHQYAPTWLAQLPALLKPEDLETVQRRIQGGTRERMLREIVDVFEALSAEHPLMLVLEDLHWSDPSTVELLATIAQRRESAQLFVVGTYRTAELAVNNHPLKTVKHELLARGQATEIALSFLSPAAVREYVTHRLAQHQTADALADFVYQRTDGQPLFMVQVTEYVARQLGAAVFTATDAHQLAIPRGLRELIEAQLGRLTEEEQHLLAVSSIVGTEFTAASVAAGIAGTDATIEAVCNRLARRGQFIEERGVQMWPDGTVSGRYGFRHALYQDVIYTRLPEAQRVRLHKVIGERLESGYGARAQEIASELAMHFTRGLEVHRAVSYLHAAADKALRRHANVEAIRLLTQALEVLQAWPDTPARIQQELVLQLALGVPLLQTKGQASPEVERTYNRAQELSQQVGDTPQLFLALLGMWRFYSNRAQYQNANRIAEQFLRRAQNGQDTVRLTHAHAMQAQTSLLLGDFIQAKDRAEQGLALYEARQHRSQLAHYGIDAKIFCLSYASHALWMLGYPDQALQYSQEMLTWSQELSHTFNLVLALERSATCHLLRREVQAVHEREQEGKRLAREHEFAAREAYGQMLQGWVLAQRHQCEEGIAHLREGLAAFLATGAELFQTYFLAMLAEAYGKGGRPEDGLQAIAEALTLVGKTRERLYEAELWRLKGELLQQVNTQKCSR